MKGKMILAANRLPVRFARKDGVLELYPSAGGVATGLGALHRTLKSLWVGWPGVVVTSENDRRAIVKALSRERMRPVILSQAQVAKYYEGFSNRTLWPLFHYFHHAAVFDEELWRAYKNVNQLFCDEVLCAYKPGDTVWIHDYQLMLLPDMIRKRHPDAAIGYFLHIPFPSFEIFRALPWRTELIQGLLGADLIGFHTHDYARHFLSAAMRLLGLENHFGRLEYENRVLDIDAFPMGIDYAVYANAHNRADVQREIKRLSARFSPYRIILSIDRLDYSKGILKRLEAYERFLTENPAYKEKVKLILLVVPSRERVDAYAHLKEQVDGTVGRINGSQGTFGWSPIWYLYRTVPFHTLAALYRLADVCLITPFRDGMNLVAKEFVASGSDRPVALILSELAGSADELGEAYIVNPHDEKQISEAMRDALTASDEELGGRMREMQVKLSRYNVHRWCEDFLSSLGHVKSKQETLKSKLFGPALNGLLLRKYEKSRVRTLLLDYDGTLVPFAAKPKEATPDKELLNILQVLSRDERNRVVIISGRDRLSMEQWLGRLSLYLVAEHGAWLREPGGDWRNLEPLNQEWKREIRPILELYVDRTPGSLIEEKNFSIVWHYRKVEIGLGVNRARQLADTLAPFASNLHLRIREGAKVIEINTTSINKGRAALHLLERFRPDFVLAFGDDLTDEDLFSMLPAEAHTVKVGMSATAAKHIVPSFREVRNALIELGGMPYETPA